MEFQKICLHLLHMTLHSLLILVQLLAFLLQLLNLLRHAALGPRRTLLLLLHRDVVRHHAPVVRVAVRGGREVAELKHPEEKEALEVQLAPQRGWVKRLHRRLERGGGDIPHYWLRRGRFAVRCQQWEECVDADHRAKERGREGEIEVELCEERCGRGHARRDHLHELRVVVEEQQQLEENVTISVVEGAEHGGVPALLLVHHLGDRAREHQQHGLQDFGRNQRVEHVAARVAGKRELFVPLRVRDQECGGRETTENQKR